MSVWGGGLQQMKVQFSIFKLFKKFRRSVQIFLRFRVAVIGGGTLRRKTIEQIDQIAD